MRLSIDAEAEALYLKLREGKVNRSQEVWDGIVLDLDEAGEVLGVEILWLSRRIPLEASKTLNLELPFAATGVAEHGEGSTLSENGWRHLLEDLVSDLRRLTEDPHIELKPYKKTERGFSLNCAPYGRRGGKVLAFLEVQPRLNRLKVQIEGGLVNKAGVADLMDKPDPRGIWGLPAYLKYVPRSGFMFDVSAHREAMEILEKVWRRCRRR